MGNKSPVKEVLFTGRCQTAYRTNDRVLPPSSDWSPKSQFELAMSSTSNFVRKAIPTEPILDFVCPVLQSARREP